MLSKTALETLFANIHTGGFTVVWWDGARSKYGPDASEFTLHLKNKQAIGRILRNISHGFGESYMEGLIDIEGDVHDVVALANRNKAAFPKLATKSFFGNLVRGVGRGASLKESKADIHAHYDLGNDFYRLWLDQEWMQYTCAYYPKKSATLEEAQTYKLDQVARKLILKKGMQVVEVGGGWGGLAIFLAKHHDVKVRSFNISHEQITHARAWARKESLTDRIEFIEDDYRNATGTADRFVSVGIFEHVGRPNHPEYFKGITKILKPGGVSLLHTITTDVERPTDPWIGKYIFPGGYIPSWREVIDRLPEFDLHLTDVQSLRMHYAMTLDEWAKRFEQHRKQITEERGEAFVRMWRLYLRASAANFRTSGLDLHQFVFTHGLNNDLPLDRLSYLKS